MDPGAKLVPFEFKELIDEALHERVEEQRRRLLRRIESANKLHHVATSVTGGVHTKQVDRVLRNGAPYPEHGALPAQQVLEHGVVTHTHCHLHWTKLVQPQADLRAQPRRRRDIGAVLLGEILSHPVVHRRESVGSDHVDGHHPGHLARTSWVVERHDATHEHGLHRLAQPERARIAEGRATIPAHGRPSKEDARGLRAEHNRHLLTREVVEGELQELTQQVLTPVDAADVKRGLPGEEREPGSVQHVRLREQLRYATVDFGRELERRLCVADDDGVHHKGADLILLEEEWARFIDGQSDEQLLQDFELPPGGRKLDAIVSAPQSTAERERVEVARCLRKCSAVKGDRGLPRERVLRGGVERRLHPGLVADQHDIDVTPMFWEGCHVG